MKSLPRILNAVSSALAAKAKTFAADKSEVIDDYAAHTNNLQCSRHLIKMDGLSNRLPKRRPPKRLRQNQADEARCQPEDPRSNLSIFNLWILLEQSAIAIRSGVRRQLVPDAEQLHVEHQVTGYTKSRHLSSGSQQGSTGAVPIGRDLR